MRDDAGMRWKRLFGVAAPLFFSGFLLRHFSTHGGASGILCALFCFP